MKYSSRICFTSRCFWGGSKRVGGSWVLNITYKSGLACEKIQSWAWMLLLQSVLVQVSGSEFHDFCHVRMESCCLVGFKVCPAGFNLSATLGINVVSWFLIPSFTLPSPGQRLHPPTGMLVVVSFCWPVPFHLLPPKKRREMLLSPSQTSSECSGSHPAESTSLITPRNQTRNKWLRLQRPCPFHKWLFPWAARDLGSSSSLGMTLRTEVREFWGHSHETVQLELKTAVIVSSAGWMQKEGIPVWPLSHRSMQDQEPVLNLWL